MCDPLRGREFASGPTGAAMMIYFALALASLNPIVSFESKVQDRSQRVLVFLFCVVLFRWLWKAQLFSAGCHFQLSCNVYKGEKRHSRTGWAADLQTMQQRASQPPRNTLFASAPQPSRCLLRRLCFACRQRSGVWCSCCF